MSKLLDEVRRLTRLRHYSYRTGTAYVLLLLLRITVGGVFQGYS